MLSEQQHAPCDCLCVACQSSNASRHSNTLVVEGVFVCVYVAEPPGGMAGPSKGLLDKEGVQQ